VLSVFRESDIVLSNICNEQTFSRCTNNLTIHRACRVFDRAYERCAVCDELLGRVTTGKEEMASGSQPNVVEFPEDVDMADDNDYGSC